ncbi:MAG: phosphate ABC transporter permease subunit PstC, partial [Acaryochloridaceae cyanobacterium CSU_5_19]|nr:phosphate ABC transporter permease subunit PstC [Acaryochloridaceae cyanobacterium CSU_5_19]
MTVTPQGQYASRLRSRTEKGIDGVFFSLTAGFAISIGVLLLSIGLVVTINALPAIQAFGLKFLITSEWNPVSGREAYGALPMIYGTLVSAILALLIAVPLGVGTAIFLSENFIPLAFRTVLVFMVELLAAIPSVVYGLWGIFVLIPITKEIGRWLHNTLGWIPFFSTMPRGPGMLPAALVLAIMILPIITAIS